MDSTVIPDIITDPASFNADAAFWIHAAQAAIRRHINRGNFDAQKMVKAYRNVMDFAAQEYTREYGTRGKNGSYGCFSPADRQQAAEMMAAADAAEYNCNRWE